jgi:hypothetical protein
VIVKSTRAAKEGLQENQTHFGFQFSRAREDGSILSGTGRAAGQLANFVMYSNRMNVYFLLLLDLKILSNNTEIYKLI